MKKLNNKGITLVELIVSFALVSVSVIYFYQTVYTVRKLYSNSQKATEQYVKANFAFRLANELFDTGCVPNSVYNLNVFNNAIDGDYKTNFEDGFCEINFTIDDKDYTLYKPPILLKDDSRFKYDAALLGGAKVDGDEGNKYINFDGNDDFVQLPELPGCASNPENPDCIKWSEGFIVEFNAKWDTLANWSRIFDFGNGQNSNNILVGNWQEANTLALAGRKGVNTESGYKTVDLEILKNADLLSIHKYKIVYDTSDLKIYVYKDDSLVNTLAITADWIYNDVTRTLNYVGKSNWTDDKYFHGRLYYLKIDAYVGKDTTAENGVKETILDINANNYVENTRK